MTMLNLIAEKIATLEQASQQFENFSEFVSQFQQSWLEIGRELQEHLIQERIRQIESKQMGCRQIRTRTYHTPIGTMKLQRRIYKTERGYECLSDQVLCLPHDAWLPAVLELASGLGVSSEFANAQQLFERWTSIEVSQRTIANQVEAAGQRLQSSEFGQTLQATAPLDSVLKQAVVPAKLKPRVYVGVDGVMIPLNQAQGYKEALVGVVFKELDHWRISPKRAEIRVRHYVATLKSREQFQERVYQLYTQVVAQSPYEL